MNLREYQKNIYINLKSTNCLHALPNISTTYNSPSRLSQLNFIRPLIKVLWSNDLLKPNWWDGYNYSAGTLSYLSSAHSIKLVKEPYTVLRKKWTTWKIIQSLLLPLNSTRYILFIKVWCIRSRRFLAILRSEQISYLITHLQFNQTTFPKKRIKRWLKKKYSTTGWR